MADTTREGVTIRDGAVLVTLGSGSTIPSPTFTGQSSFANGSAASPSIKFAGEATTGFFWETNGAVDISSSGTATHRFQGNGHWMRSDTATIFFGAAADVQAGRIAAGALNFALNVATPAGGSAAASVRLGTTTALGVYFGSGAPTVSAAQGSLYMRTDGSSTSTRMYVNSDGGTTWVAVTTAS